MIECDTKLEKFKYQGYSGINVFLSDNKEYFIKKYKKNKKEMEKLYNNVKFYLMLEKTKIKLFVLKIEKILDCKNYFLYITKTKEDSVKYLINNISFKNMQNIFLQTLLFTFYVKYNLKTIHGDLHLRNILYEKIDKKINFKIKIKNKNFNLNINNYLIKVIDLDSNGKYNFKEESKDIKKKIKKKVKNLYTINYKYDFFKLIKYFIIELSKKYNINKLIKEINNILMDKKKNMWEKELEVYN